MVCGQKKEGGVAKVMVVDNEEDSRSTLVSMLDGEGFEVEGAVIDPG